jgi:peptide/nickel transport system permease protein/dipeptide transport system permease protein
MLGLKKNFKKLLSNKGAFVGLIIIVLFLFMAIFSPLLSPFNPEEIVGNTKLDPFWLSGDFRHLLGTDDLGRDTLSRLIFGGRISLIVGLFVVLISMTFGILLGLVSGFYGGLIDQFTMRIMDILMALPSILLAIVVVAVLGPGLSNAIIAVSIVALPPFVRVVRASVLEQKEKEYVAASRALGLSNKRIMFRQILPNCTPSIIVQASLGFSDGILNTAALGFLGLGAQAPTPEWGIMLADAKAFIESSPWMVTLPGLCILIVVLSFNLLGDGLRDVLDPKTIN